MKKILLTLLLTAVLLPLFALRPGDNVVEIAALKWINGVPVSVLPERESKNARSKIILFFQTTDFNSREALMIFDQLRRTYGRSCRFAAVTPSLEQEANAFVSSLPKSLSVAVDNKRDITSNYMEKSSFFPMAFIVSPQGKIVWNGEAVDLAEALANYFGGRMLQEEKQRELSKLMDDLQLQLRESDERRMKNTIRQIFKLDPANAAAIRIRLFVLQSSGRNEEAWQFLMERLKDAPEVKRLYFTAIDLAGSTTSSALRVSEAIQLYQKKITQDPEADALLAWTLLQRHPEDGASLAAAVALSRRAAKNMPQDAALTQKAALGSTLALTDYRLGRLSQACKRQHEVIVLLEKAGMTAAAQAARKRETFYRAAYALSQDPQ